MSPVTTETCEIESAGGASAATPAEEVASLAWAMIDGVASMTDRQRLADLLAKERELRRRYVQAIQLNGHLQRLFATDPVAASIPTR